jgi:hypothetical protein
MPSITQKFDKSTELTCNTSPKTGLSVVGVSSQSTKPMYIDPKYGIQGTVNADYSVKAAEPKPIEPPKMTLDVLAKRREEAIQNVARKEQEKQDAINAANTSKLHRQELLSGAAEALGAKKLGKLGRYLTPAAEFMKKYSLEAASGLGSLAKGVGYDLPKFLAQKVVQYGPNAIKQGVIALGYLGTGVPILLGKVINYYGNKLDNALIEIGKKRNERLTEIKRLKDEGKNVTEINAELEKQEQEIAKKELEDFFNFVNDPTNELSSDDKNRFTALYNEITKKYTSKENETTNYVLVLKIFLKAVNKQIDEDEE